MGCSSYRTARAEDDPGERAVLTNLVWETCPESDNAGPTFGTGVALGLRPHTGRYVSFDRPRRSSCSCLACRCRQNSIT